MTTIRSLAEATDGELEYLFDIHLKFSDNASDWLPADRDTYLRFLARLSPQQLRADRSRGVEYAPSCDGLGTHSHALLTQCADERYWPSLRPDYCLLYVPDGPNNCPCLVLPQHRQRLRDDGTVRETFWVYVADTTGLYTNFDPDDIARKSRLHYLHQQGFLDDAGLITHLYGYATELEGALGGLVDDLDTRIFYEPDGVHEHVGDITDPELHSVCGLLRVSPDTQRAITVLANNVIFSKDDATYTKQVGTQIPVGVLARPLIERPYQEP